MSDTIKIKKNCLDIKFSGHTTLDKRLSQVGKIISLVSKTKSKYLLIRIQPDAILAMDTDIKILLNKVQQDDFNLRKRGIFIKVAIFVDMAAIDAFDAHKKILLSKELTNIQIFGCLKEAKDWLNIESSINDVTAFFQPIVDLRDNNIIGYEALARKIVDDKIIPINDWLPQLFNEKNGSFRLTEKMLALAEKKSEQLDSNQYISVNFEISEINSNGIESLLSVFAEKKFMKQLVVEVCERGDIEIDHQQLIANINQLNARIAIDDLGSGNSRILELLDFSPEIVKLDKQIIGRIQEKKVASFVTFFSAWCEQNNISLLAEGIETQKVADACKEAGINLGQGFLFGRPQAELLGQEENDQKIKIKSRTGKAFRAPRKA